MMVLRESEYKFGGRIQERSMGEDDFWSLELVIDK